MKTLPLLLLLMLGRSDCKAQQGYQYNSQHLFSCRERFMDFCQRLPGYYERRDLDSIEYLLDDREKYCGLELDLQWIRVLLAIDRGNFRITDLPVRGFYRWLDSYAGYYREFNLHDGFISYYGSKYFNATRFDRYLFHVTGRWAAFLLQQRQLDSTETYLCRVFSGQVRKPRHDFLSGHPGLQGLDSLYLRSTMDQRQRPNPNFAIGLGLWMPRGQLGRLGTHPSLHLVMAGIRNKFNQLDLNMTLRFLSSAHSYTVRRQDSLYNRNYYLGGYFGLDYTRYLHHSLHWEWGPLAGAGYDGFDIAYSGKNYHASDYLVPLGIGSFNFNLGWRLNYFFRPNNYLGITARYNFLDYTNPGGSPLGGNAFSLELLIGAN